MIQHYHDCSGKTYLHLCRTINKILREDCNLNYTLSICERTLRRYADGDVIPQQPHVIKAIAKILKVEPAELLKNLKEFKREKNNNKQRQSQA